VALGVGLAAAAGEGLKKAVEFQSEMLKIQTQAGASAKDVKTLSAQVLELGKTAEQGPQQLSEALYHLKSVGMDNVSAMKALKVSSDLAAVGGSDLEATTNALAGAWRTGIRGAKNMTQAAQTLNATIGAGNMTMEDMVAALGTGILPTAKTFGLTLSQVGAALALFTDEGVDSASAATRLRMSISLLGAPSRAAEKQLNRIHLSGQKLGDAMRGPDGIIGAIRMLKAHLDASGLSATQSAALLSHAFGGGKSSSAILSMVNNLDVLEQKQAQVNSSMGKYGPAVEAQRKTASAQLKIIESNLEVFAIKAGNVLLPPFTSMVTYITRTALPAVHSFGHAMATKLVPVDAIKAQFGRLTGAVGDFFAGFKPASKKAKIKVPSPQIEGPKIPALLKKPYVFKVPSPTLKGSKSTIPDLIAKPKKQASQAKQFGQQLRKLISGGIGDAIKNAWKDIDWSKLGHQIGSGLATAIGWVGKHMADLTKKVIKALSKIDWVEVGKSFGRMAIPLAIGIVTSLFDPLFSADFWKKHWLDTIIAIVSAIPVGRLGGAAAKIFSKIPVLKAFAPFLEKIAGLGKAVEKPMGKILMGVGKVAKGIAKGFIDGLERVFPGMSRAVTSRFRGLVYAIYSAAIDTGAAAVRLAKGIGNGILKGAEGLGSIIGRVVGYVVKPFAKAGGWLAGKGAAVVGGLRSGIASGARRLGAWTTDHVVKPVTGAFSSAGSWLLGRGSSVVSGLRSGVSSGARGLGTWLKKNLVDKVTGAFSKAGSWLRHSGSSLVSGLLSGATALLSDAAHGVARWASSIKDKIVGAIKRVFGIHSPSRVMAGLGGHMMSGLLHGLLSGRQALENAVKGLFSSPLDAARVLLANGVALPAEWARKVAGTVVGGVKKVAGGVGSVLGSIPGFASGGLARIGTTALVGERGPELMRVTPQGARVYSSPQTSNMMAAVQGRTGGGRAPAPVVVVRQGDWDVHVHVNDPALRDLIDVVVTPKIRASEERSAYRATVGRR
jgi:TP901 family phage tail tape measure protein